MDTQFQQKLEVFAATNTDCSINLISMFDSLTGNNVSAPEITGLLKPRLF